MTMRRVLALAILTCVVVWAPVAWGEEPDEPAPQSLEELQQRIQAVLDETRTPGVGLALVNREGTEWAGGIGLADVASGRPATGDTLFRIGSVSKMFVALAVLTLVEDGGLSLDDTAASRAPDVAFTNAWEETDPVRVVHLLEHTAGFDDISLREYADNREPPISLAEGLALRPNSRTARWRPGTRHAYCNAGPAFAARIVEHVTGATFEQWVRERFFQPLQMNTATFLKPDDPSRLATLYYSDGVTPQPYWHICMRPAGSLNASPAEMANLVRLLLNRGWFEGRQLLSSESIERMEHPASGFAVRAGLATGYGLANYTSRERGFIFRGHDGGVNGGAASLAYLPAHGIGYVFMINSGSGEAFRRIRSLVAGYLTRELQPPKPPESVPVPDDLAERFAGWYQPDSPRTEMLRWLEQLLGVARVGVREDTLTFDPLLGEADTFMTVTERLYRHEKSPVPGLALMEDPDGGLLIQFGTATARRIPTGVFLLRTGGAAVVAALLLAVLPVFAVWAPLRFLRRRFLGRRRIGVLGWPALAVLCLAGSALLLVASQETLFERFGRPTFWSIGLCVGTIAFALFALAALVATWRARRDDVAWLTLAFARAVAVAAVIEAGYLAWWGWIGIRLWL
jgi:CubicO group peptidase (beta-lactamase class C family)